MSIAKCQNCKLPSDFFACGLNRIYPDGRCTVRADNGVMHCFKSGVNNSVTSNWYTVGNNTVLTFTAPLNVYFISNILKTISASRHKQIQQWRKIPFGCGQCKKTVFCSWFEQPACKNKELTPQFQLERGSVLFMLPPIVLKPNCI